MKLIQAVRQKRYSGPIKECPNKTASEVSGDRQKLLEEAYNKWAEEFFKAHPRGKLSHNGFSTDTLVVFGTGGGGQWLVAWWFEEHCEVS